MPTMGQAATEYQIADPYEAFLDFCEISDASLRCH
jgi:hypothetical protein